MPRGRARGRALPAGRRLEMARFLSGCPSTVVDLASLAQRFAVSEQTVRRDLLELERQGLVRRTFGGAIVQGSVQRYEPSFHEREHLNADSKQAIAEATLPTLRDGEVTFFDGSSTVLHLVRLLPAEWSGAAATTGLPALNELLQRQRARLTVLGGTYEHGSRCVRGATTQDQLADLRFDTAYVSARSLHPEVGLCEASAGEAEIKRLILAHAVRVVVLLDSSKLGSIAAHHYADLGQIARLVVDDGASTTILGDLHDRLPELVVAPTDRQMAAADRNVAPS